MNSNLRIKKLAKKSFIIIIAMITIGTSFSFSTIATTNNEISPRQLALFASLSYADIENINGYNINSISNISIIKNFANEFTKLYKNMKFGVINMVTDEQLKSIKSNTNLLSILPLSRPLSFKNENTYDYLFYGLATTSEVKDWNIINYTKFNTTALRNIAQFTAMTFKKGNNIVISYRGTDFNDIGDWLQDFNYGILNYSGQEYFAQEYALRVAQEYCNSNIYVTGHSLGGYLAQIGGGALISNNNYKNIVKQIAYFNGMGLFFQSNYRNNNNFLLNQNAFNETKKSFSKFVFSKNSEIILYTQLKTKKALTNWVAEGNKDKLILYRIKGDLISSLGKHYGQIYEYEPSQKCIEHHTKEKVPLSFSDNFCKSILDFLKPFMNNTDSSIYFDKYVCNDMYENGLLTYIWITHETDSFFDTL